MNHAVYYIGFRFMKTPIPEKAFDPVFDQMGSWIRYNGFTWFLFTSLGAEQIYNILKSLITADDNVMILAIDPSRRFGWAPSFVWKWIDEVAKISEAQNVNPVRNPPTGVAFEPMNLLLPWQR